MKYTANLLWGSVSVFPRGQFIRAHCHESFFHLFYAMKGRLSMRFGEEDCELQPGMAGLAAMNQNHEMREVAQDAVAGELKFSIFPGTLCDALNRCGGALTLSGKASRRLEDLFDEVSAGARSNPEIEQALLYAALLQIAQDNTASETVAPEKPVSACTASAIRFIKDNFCRNILLEDIAANTGHNSNYLCTLFKKETGVSTNEYLNMLRIHKAADMILYGDREIAQIASLCGFQSPSHFSQTFKRHAGLLPTECRQLFYRAVAGIQEFPTHPHHERTIPTSEFMNMRQVIGRMDGFIQTGEE